MKDSENSNITMTTIEEQIALKDKIMAGFDLVYQRLLEFKKQKKSVLVVMEEGEIVFLTPEEAEKRDELERQQSSDTLPQ
ncbi:MAG: hypothetical protein MUC87_15590 [Bacteroidia bacterium]|jgi:hypothetical protein|nr:hypothetical protein [Bacteroidia bacterium]